MLKRDLNEHLIAELQPFFEIHGYKLKKTSEVIFFRKGLATGFQDIGISSTNYYNIHYLNFGYAKRVNPIEDVVFKLQQFFEANLFLIRKDTSTYYLNVASDVNIPWLNKELKTKPEVSEVTDWIKQYTINYAFERFAFLEDIQAVDAEINGNHLWLDDKNSKPFGLHRFDVHRIVIAKMAKSSSEYNKFTERLMEIEEKRIEEIRRADLKYANLKNWFVPKILTHLEEIC
jgi:hypothetical protein